MEIENSNKKSKPYFCVTSRIHAAIYAEEEVEIKRAGTLVESGSYHEALTQIYKLRKHGHGYVYGYGCQDRRLGYYEAVCKFHLGEYLTSLRLANDFLNRKEETNNLEEMRDHTLFISAVCLNKLGLSTEAIQILNTLPSNYPGIENERSTFKKIEENHKRALRYFQSITGKRKRRINFNLMTIFDRKSA